ncbi:MAG: YkgJ family cysteine cluster protein [Nitrososphaeraceae archaeon]
MNKETSIKSSLDFISKKWKIDPKIYDIHLGKRSDIIDTLIQVNQVIFHIPKLTKDNLYVIWNCLWPECHNCCEKQGRLPLTNDDITNISKRLGYPLKSEFVRNETNTSSWQEDGNYGNLITFITMISLRRKKDEKEEEDGHPVKCRFLDKEGYCKIQSDKPGVCWLYPFASWIESRDGKPVIHATFQFTGDCPGYYLSNNIDEMVPILSDYSSKIYDYNMSINRTFREGFGIANIIY